MYMIGATLDDLLRRVLSKLVLANTRILPSRGPATELTGVLLQIADPRARLSRTENRGRLFSSLGELLWYLSKTNALNFITYYVPRYAHESDDRRTVHGGYGPRLFAMRGVDQLANVITLLSRNPHSRRAVIQLFDALDIVRPHKDVPCTCTLQFMIRRDRLDMFTNMRSNDAFLGLPHDIFAFTMLQELVARSLNVEVGTYTHAVGSLHLYDVDKSDAHKYLDEGWQSTVRMPPMPLGDPWESIGTVLQAERAIRRIGKVDPRLTGRLEPYWADIVGLLHIFCYFKRQQLARIPPLKRRLQTHSYDTYIEQKTESVTKKIRGKFLLSQGPRRATRPGPMIASAPGKGRNR